MTGIIYAKLNLKRVRCCGNVLRWRVMWQTGIMRAPAFYYYDTKEEALARWPEFK